MLLFSSFLIWFIFPELKITEETSPKCGKAIFFASIIMYTEAKDCAIFLFENTSVLYSGILDIVRFTMFWRLLYLIHFELAVQFLS